jgi:hypothetical protein
MPATPIALGLGLLVCTVGLLIAPGPYHRFVEAGQDSGRLHRFTTFIADLALLPFALALGIGLFVGAEGIFDDSAAGSRRARWEPVWRLLSGTVCHSCERGLSGRGSA